MSFQNKQTIFQGRVNVMSKNKKKSPVIIFFICLFALCIISILFSYWYISLPVAVIGISVAIYIIQKRKKDKGKINNNISDINFDSVPQNFKIETEINKKPDTTFIFGNANAKQISLDFTNINKIRECFISFDVETTGLNCKTDRIVEIGAVLFRNGKVDKEFSTLVNPGISISQKASSINHITNEMLSSAPSESEVYANLVDFLGDALQGKTVMCAHNANFDFSFLCNTLSRLGYNANIEYLDTLKIARQYLHGLVNYKQPTIENHFGLINTASHRAGNDAENCGYILTKLIDLAFTDLEKEELKKEKLKLTQEEMEICAFVQKKISERCDDISLLGFRKNSSGYVEAGCFYKFLKFKCTKKNNYILVKSDCENLANYITEPCTQSEGGEQFLRLIFSSPFDLEEFAEYFYNKFLESRLSAEEYASYYNKNLYDENNSFTTQLTEENVCSLLESAKNKPIIEVNIIADKPVQQTDISVQKEMNSTETKQPRGRIIIQMDANENIIREFETIFAASKEVGISPKCIRDAANGIQKTAGGFKWKYKL